VDQKGRKKAKTDETSGVSGKHPILTEIDGYLSRSTIFRGA